MMKNGWCRGYYLLMAAADGFMDPNGFHFCIVDLMHDGDGTAEIFHVAHERFLYVQKSRCHGFVPVSYFVSTYFGNRILRQLNDDTHVEEENTKQP